MKLSTKGRYSARAMLDLAMHYNKGNVALKDIARRQDISVRYLERMMGSLVSAGLVRSSRGKNGGFSLAMQPEKIKLSQVVQAVEGSLAPVYCVDDPMLCERADSCVTRGIWEKMKEAILEVLDSVTLKNMVEIEKKRSSKSKNEMYYI